MTTAEEYRHIAEEFFRRAPDAKTEKERKRFLNRVRPARMATYGSPHARLSDDQAPEPDVPVQRCSHSHLPRRHGGKDFYSRYLMGASRNSSGFGAGESLND
jgi:hypothetical protein